MIVASDQLLASQRQLPTTTTRPVAGHRVRNAVRAAEQGRAASTRSRARSANQLYDIRTVGGGGYGLMWSTARSSRRLLVPPFGCIPRRLCAPDQVRLGARSMAPLPYSSSQRPTPGPSPQIGCRRPRTPPSPSPSGRSCAADDEVPLTPPRRLPLVSILAIRRSDNIRVLLDRNRWAVIGWHGLLVLALYPTSVGWEVRPRAPQAPRQAARATGTSRDLLLSALHSLRRGHQLQVVDDRGFRWCFCRTAADLRPRSPSGTCSASRR